MLTEPEKTQLSYLFVSLFQLKRKEARHKMVELVEKFNGVFSPNVKEILALVMAAQDAGEPE